FHVSTLRWALFPTMLLIACHSAIAQRAGRTVAVNEGVEQFYKDFDEKGLNEPAPRDFKLAAGPVEKMRLPKPDPKILENKFIARFELSTNVSRKDSERSMNLSRYWQLAESPFADRVLDPMGNSLFDPNGYGRAPNTREKKPWSEFFKTLVTNCP